MRITVICPLTVFILFAFTGYTRGQVESPGPARIMESPSGIRFALLGKKAVRPSPTLVVFAGAMRRALEEKSANTLGWILAQHDFLSVALDIPCHGDDQRPGEPPGLSGWRHRLEKGENFLAEFLPRVSTVLDFLIQEEYVDPKRIVAFGPSRGGFMALHLAAVEPRIGAVVAFAPVTDLLALREFGDMKDPALALPLDVMSLAPKLATRHLFIQIGHNDLRVGSRHAVDFALKLMELSPSHMKPMQDIWSEEVLKLVITPSESPGGHSTYNKAHPDAATWILRWVGDAGN